MGSDPDRDGRSQAGDNDVHLGWSKGAGAGLRGTGWRGAGWREWGQVESGWGEGVQGAVQSRPQIMMFSGGGATRQWRGRTMRWGGGRVEGYGTEGLGVGWRRTGQSSKSGGAGGLGGQGTGGWGSVEGLEVG